MKTLGLFNGDIDFRNGDIVLISDSDEVAQCIEISLAINMGEWFLDESKGTEHMRLLDQATDDESRAEVIRVISQEVRVANIESIVVTSDYKKRKRVIEYVVTLVDGTILERTVTLDA